MSTTPDAPKVTQSSAAQSSEHSNSDKGGSQKQKTEKVYMSPITWASLGVIAAGGLGTVMYYNFEKQKHIRSVRMGPSIGELQVGGPFELVDTEGTVVTERDLLGKYALIYFGFTHCPDICPNELTKMGDVMNALEKNPSTRGLMQPVFISVDPGRDSPAILKAYAQDWHPSIRYLTGSHEQIQSVSKAYRIYFSKPAAKDRKCIGYFGQNMNAEQLTEKITEYMIGTQFTFSSFLKGMLGKK